MKKWTIAMAGVLAFSTLAVARPASEKEERERVANAGRVVKEILDVPDNIPQDVLDKARCVVVLPSVVKAAFVVGGSYGRGVMVCRRGHDYAGPWGAPVMMALEGGSVGFQIGGEATDFVILVMNDRGMSSMLHSKVKLGGDASIAAGPKGRTASAESDVTLRAEMLSYSRSRGAFAGVSLEGSTLRPDGGANEKLYGKGVTAAEIVEEGKREGPEEGRLLVSRLQQASPHLQK
ncbi:MAG TPA: lipid-binding SYLF domain-containing protein [Methylomirabilota bacterium]|jgi:lipid-binding SYLF domain-containing protein|nr:lipid-binding SYLF domain-containing protein [Methylomirabilota bacterium]